jgi:ribosome maturation factor RimP
MIQEKGTDTVPFFFVAMASDIQIQTVTDMMQHLLESNPSYFIVSVRITPTNNIKIALDADTGVSIDRCAAYSRELYKKIEEVGLFPDGDFALEVSSPGLDEPLKMYRQYLKNIGRKVEVLLNDGTQKEGKLLSVDEKEIVLEETRGKNKKQEVLQHTLSFDNIKSTKIQIVF